MMEDNCKTILKENAVEEISMFLAENKHYSDTPLRIVNFLDEEEYEYRVSIEERDVMYFRIVNNISDDLYIRYSPRLRKTGVYMLLKYDPDAVKRNMYRLLYACNYNNNGHMRVNATLEEYDVLIWYAMHCEECDQLESLLKLLINEILNNVDTEMFNRAANDTDMDIEEYCKNKDREFHEGIKTMINKYREQND